MGRPRRTDWQEPFLENFAGHGIQAWAARAANVSTNTIEAERKRDPEFEERYEAAYEESTATLERTAITLGTSGMPFKKTRRVTGPDGAVTETVEEGLLLYPPMLMFMLKARRPTVYRENVHVEQTGKDGGPIRYAATREEVDETADEFSARVIRLADARRAAGGAQGDS